MKNRSIAFVALALTALITLSLAAACGAESAVQIPPETAVSPPPSAPVAPEPAPQAEYVPNELYIRYNRYIGTRQGDGEQSLSRAQIVRDTLARAVIAEDLRSVGYEGDFKVFGGRVYDYSDSYDNLYFVRTTDDIDALALSGKLTELDDITLVSPNFIHFPDAKTIQYYYPNLVSYCGYESSSRNGFRIIACPNSSAFSSPFLSRSGQ